MFPLPPIADMQTPQANLLLNLGAKLRTIINPKLLPVSPNNLSPSLRQKSRYGYSHLEYNKKVLILNLTLNSTMFLSI